MHVHVYVDWKYTRFENLVIGNVRTFPKKCQEMSLAFLPFCMGTFLTFLRKCPVLTFPQVFKSVFSNPIAMSSFIFALFLLVP